LRVESEINPGCRGGFTSRPQILLVIVGPTAVGKSEVAIGCARLLNGEIVSADSMQVYRGLDIGTAKPTAAQRALVPHHLIDVVSPDEDFSVAIYKARAEAIIDDIFPRGRQPILVGGSGLYIKAVTGTWGLTIAPRAPALRQRLQNEVQEKGLRALHERLMRIDPEAAARISPSDEKRLLRALEVFEITGLPISHFHRLDRHRQPKYNSLMIGLTLPRQALYARIEERVDRMMEAYGFLEEVKGLLQRGYHRGLVSMRALGYAHIASHLAGEVDLEAAVKLFKRDSRRFAKRQLTWFRNQPDIHWLDVEGRSPSEVAKESVKIFKAQD